MRRIAALGTRVLRVHRFGDQRAEAAMTERERLPTRRRSETFDFDVPVGTTVLRYTATVGYYLDGRIGELFLNNHKSNSTADTNARDAAIAFSFAVQHGADIEDIRKALCRETDGRASGPLGAALDLITNAIEPGPVPSPKMTE